MRSVYRLRAVVALSLQLLLTVVFLSCDSEPSSCRKACESEQVCKTANEELGYCSADGFCKFADCESDDECGDANPDNRCIRANGRGSCGIPCDENGDCEGVTTCQEKIPGAWICTSDCRKSDDIHCPYGLVCSPETGVCACTDDEACGEGKVCR